MNHNIILDNLTKYQDRVDDLNTSLKREQEEALLRSQTILLIDRNVGREYVIRRIMKRFRKCVNG